MTERLTALRDLLGAVEAGEARPYVIEECAAAIWSVAVWKHVSPAYAGSLDAAKALHDAVLPDFIVDEFSQNSRSMGWTVTIVNEAGRYISSHWPELGFQSNPARAWLIAILRALIAEAEQKEGA